MAWFIPILIGLALSIVGYLIRPKPKTQKPPAAQDLDGPTADAGRPIPVVFGSIEVRSPNNLWYGDKSKREFNT